MIVSSQPEPAAALCASASAAAPPASPASSFILISLCTMRSYSDSMNSTGRSPPSLMPRLLRRKSALLILFFTCELWASVLSMMTE
jgi:hypothetical protein